MEQLQYNLLFRLFVGLNMDESVWVPTAFSNLPDLRWRSVWSPSLCDDLGDHSNPADGDHLNSG